jgi:uncharacterized protein (DUF2062 family)
MADPNLTFLQSVTVLAKIMAGGTFLWVPLWPVALILAILLTIAMMICEEK